MFVRLVEETLAARDSLLRRPEDVEREAGRLADLGVGRSCAMPRRP